MSGLAALVFVLAPAARGDGNTVATFDDGGDRDCRLVFCRAMTCKNAIIIWATGVYNCTTTQ